MMKTASPIVATSPVAAANSLPSTVAPSSDPVPVSVATGSPSSPTSPGTSSQPLLNNSTEPPSSPTTSFLYRAQQFVFAPFQFSSFSSSPTPKNSITTTSTTTNTTSTIQNEEEAENDAQAPELQVTDDEQQDEAMTKHTKKTLVNHDEQQKATTATATVEDEEDSSITKVVTDETCLICSSQQKSTLVTQLCTCSTTSTSTTIASTTTLKSLQKMSLDKRELTVYASAAYRPKVGYNKDKAAAQELKGRRDCGEDAYFILSSFQKQPSPLKNRRSAISPVTPNNTPIARPSKKTVNGSNGSTKQQHQRVLSEEEDATMNSTDSTMSFHTSEEIEEEEELHGEEEEEYDIEDDEEEETNDDDDEEDDDEEEEDDDAMMMTMSCSTHSMMVDEESGMLMSQLLQDEEENQDGNDDDGDEKLGERICAIGIADGVGGYSNMGVDPSLMAWALMEQSRNALDSNAHILPYDALIEAYENIRGKNLVECGGSTACVLLISRGKSAVNKRENVLHLTSTNLGDSAFMIIRDSKVVYRSEEQTHFWNCPLQMCVPPKNVADVFQDHPKDASVLPEPFELKKGDVIVAATDGLTDNVFDERIAEIVTKHLTMSLQVDHKTRSDMIANEILQCAVQAATSRTTYTPFQKYAQENRYMFRGGKNDDICLVVACVQEDDSTTSSSS